MALATAEGKRNCGGVAAGFGHFAFAQAAAAGFSHLAAARAISSG